MRWPTGTTARRRRRARSGHGGRAVELAWSVYQKVRAIYHASTPAAGRELATTLLDTPHTCPRSASTKFSSS